MIQSAQDLVLTPRGVRFQGAYYPCSIGKGGLSEAKREGDGATPIATLSIVAMLYRADRLARPAAWARPIGPGDLWCDAPNHPAYNHFVPAPFAASHERLFRADALYDLVLVTDWNWPEAEPGRGSAIFLHQWRRPGYATEGCIAFSRAHLHQIARQIQRGTRIIVNKGSFRG